MPCGPCESRAPEKGFTDSPSLCQLGDQPDPTRRKKDTETDTETRSAKAASEWLVLRPLDVVLGAVLDLVDRVKVLIVVFLLDPTSAPHQETNAKKTKIPRDC